jgi:hypothetical protein
VTITDQATKPLIIDTPGVYDGIPDVSYHSDPVPGGSLSASGAKLLLPPNCPARFKYNLEHPPVPKEEFSFGHAAHKLVLGAGPEFSIVDADDWRTKAAKEKRDEAHSTGAVPLLRSDYDHVQAMATAILAHPLASRLFDPESGKPEQSAFWVDERTGVWRRARFDWLPNPTSGRMIISDYKTTPHADLDSIQRSVHNFGYAQQAAWYLDAAVALGLHPDPAFVFVFQERVPPYIVTLVQLDEVALSIGRDLNAQAIDLYRRCTSTGEWPGYSDDIPTISLPQWYVNRHEGA